VVGKPSLIHKVRVARYPPVIHSVSRQGLLCIITPLQSGKPSVMSRPFSRAGVRSSMRASTKKIQSVLARCLQGSNAYPVALMLIAFLLGAATASAQTRRIQLDDETKIVTVSDPQISPDGKSIVCVVTRPNLDEDRYDDELVMVEIATGAQRELTFGRKDVASPRWSPSGDRLAFLALIPYTKGNKDDGAKIEDGQQIFVMPMSGGDARRVTNAPNGVEQFAWRPNGKDIAYVTSDDSPNRKEIEKHNDSFEVGDNDYLATAAPTSSHIWLARVEDGNTGSGKAKRLTSGSWSLPTGYAAAPISWTPDGRSLTFTRREHPYLVGNRDLSTLQILNVETGEIRKLTSHEKLESSSLFSPDGSQLAYLYRRDGDFNNGNEIFVTPFAGGDGVDLTREIDRHLRRPIWMPDGKSLLVGGA
jgi:Tol biopolymer transport system component